MATQSRRSITGGKSSRGIAELVGAALIPVEPSQQFVTELGRGLSRAASLSRRSLVRRYRTAILVGAALFGSLASVVGVIALIVRQRSAHTGRTVALAQSAGKPPRDGTYSAQTRSVT